MTKLNLLVYIYIFCFAITLIALFWSLHERYELQKIINDNEASISILQTQNRLLTKYNKEYLCLE